MRIYTKKQAAKILAAMRAYLGAADAADLPEAVDDAPWSDDTNAAVLVVPCKRVDENANLQDGGTFAEDDVILLDGVTYPLKEELKEMGFHWTTDFNGIEGANHWVRPALDFDTNTVVDLFDQWGWLVTLYDGLEE